MYDIYIRALVLPLTVEGVTVMGNDGTFNVYVNSCLSDEKQIEAANHEICHIKMEHFFTCEPVICNELEAIQQQSILPKVVPEYGCVLVQQ